MVGEPFTLWAMDYMGRKQEQQYTIRNVMVRQNAKIEHSKACFPLLLLAKKDDWDLWLHSITFAYNTCRHNVLGVALYEVMFGHTPQLPLEL